MADAVPAGGPATEKEGSFFDPKYEMDAPRHYFDLAADNGDDLADAWFGRFGPSWQCHRGSNNVFSFLTVPFSPMHPQTTGDPAWGRHQA